MPAAARRKTSFEVDFDKVDAVREVLGTKTLTETVDSALEEVLLLQQRRTLLDLVFMPEALELLNPDLVDGAWR